MGRNLRGSRRDRAAHWVTEGKHEAQLMVSWGGVKSYTCILVRNDFDALDMASRLEDLPQHVLGDARVQASHIQGPFVRLRSGATRDVAGTATGWRHDIGAHWGADCSGNGVVVLRDADFVSASEHWQSVAAGLGCRHRNQVRRPRPRAGGQRKQNRPLRLMPV